MKLFKLIWKIKKKKKTCKKNVLKQRRKGTPSCYWLLEPLHMCLCYKKHYAGTVFDKTLKWNKISSQ